MFMSRDGGLGEGGSGCGGGVGGLHYTPNSFTVGISILGGSKFCYSSSSSCSFTKSIYSSRVMPGVPSAYYHGAFAISCISSSTFGYC